jgi:ADP-heptose:LPS heptosyltransferase
VSTLAPRILMSLRRSLGDSILFLETIQRVKAYFPDAKITLLVPRVYADIYQQVGLEDVWTFEAQSFFSLVLKTRRQGFDLHLDFHSSGKNIWLNRLGGAKHAFFDIHAPRTAGSSAPIPNALEWNTIFLKKVLGELPPERERQIAAPVLPLTELEKRQALERLRRMGASPKGVVFFGLGASRLTKRWPSLHFAHLAELIHDRYEKSIILVPGPEAIEQEIASQVLGQMRVRGLSTQAKGGVLLDGPLSLRQLAALLANCQIYIGNDSGPKHLAAAVGIPTLTFFGPEDPKEWHPYAQARHPLFFQEALSCRNQDNGRWCDLQECIKEKNRCLLDIDPYMALEKSKIFLESTA